MHGGGHKDLARLAAGIGDCDVFAMEHAELYTFAEWRKDLRKVMHHVASTNKSTVFMLDVESIPDDYCMDDLDTLLKIGVLQR